MGGGGGGGGGGIGVSRCQGLTQGIKTRTQANTAEKKNSFHNLKKMNQNGRGKKELAEKI